MGLLGDIFKPIGQLAGEVMGAFSEPLGELTGRNQNQDFQWKMFEANRDLQREFAQQGIRWKVQDAIGAGLHPLAALGAQGAQFSPVSVGGGAESSPIDAISSLYSMGQDLGRSVRATQTEDERQATQLALQSAQLDVEGKALDNQIRAAQLAKVTQVGPSMPGFGDKGVVRGQGDVKVKPAEAIASAPGRPGQEASRTPDVGWLRTDKGVTAVIPQSASESFENDWMGGLQWQLRNRVLPTERQGPPTSWLPPNADRWEYSFWNGEWRPVDKRGVVVPTYNPYRMDRYSPKKKRDWINRPGPGPKY